jgi:aminopeptidase YwaD
MDRLLTRRMTTFVAAALLVVTLILTGISGVACTGVSPVAVSHVTTATLASGVATTTSGGIGPSTSSATASTSSIPSSTTSATPTTSTTASTTTTTESAPRLPLAFSSARAMEHIKRLAQDIGIRPGGSAAEDKAVVYASGYLANLGYQPVVTEVPLPNGRTTHNVIVVKKGASPLTVLIGGHLDTKKTTPGGNDDASGTAAVLELARDMADADITPTIVFAVFGQEEIIDANKTHHHYGSRSYVANMTAGEREDLVAMISLDMIAYGTTFNVRTMGKGPTELRDMLLSYSAADDAGLVYLKDTGPTGWSDHEPFELAGYPAVWLQWLPDPAYHQAGDTYRHCDERVLRQTGRFLLSFLTHLTGDDLENLAASVRD